MVGRAAAGAAGPNAAARRAGDLNRPGRPRDAHHPDGAGHADRARIADRTRVADGPRLADRSDPVPDEIWEEAARHYDEKGLAAIILMIAITNLFNRVNITVRQPAGEATW